MSTTNPKTPAIPTASGAGLDLKRGLPLILAKIFAIARNTFTQLVRMKVFYFLFAFSLVLLVAGFFFADTQFEQKLKFFKDISYGFMLLFTTIFAVVGSALLIPRDIEDRTLYTILCKPVTRFEYLIGKYLGVLALVGLSLLFMDLIFSGALYVQEQRLLGPVQQALAAVDNPDSVSGVQFADEAAAIEKLGLNWNTQKGVFSIFLTGAVLAALAMLLSTFATSTMFTVTVGLCIFIVGYFQSLAREYFLRGGDDGVWQKLISVLVSIIFPDFKAFHLSDAAASGDLIANGIVVQLIGLALLYIIIYNLVAYLVFADKEL